MSDESITGVSAPRYPLRILTATVAFDGNDAAVQILRRLLQNHGCEIIHLGTGRRHEVIARAAIEEDVNAICISVSQGIRRDYFEALVSSLESHGAGRIQVYAICSQQVTGNDIEDLQNQGVIRVVHYEQNGWIYEADISEMLSFIQATCDDSRRKLTEDESNYSLATNITLAQNRMVDIVTGQRRDVITRTLIVAGAGGVGKSCLIDEILRQLLVKTRLRIACIAIAPSRRKTGGALLSDRNVMTCLESDRVYFRSLATRNERLALVSCLPNIIGQLNKAGYELVIIEASGIGQTDYQLCKLAEFRWLVMNPDSGTHSQGEKASVLGYADTVILNRYDAPGSEEALKQVSQQWRRLHGRTKSGDDNIPVLPMIASRPGPELMQPVIDRICLQFELEHIDCPGPDIFAPGPLIPVDKNNYLSEICLHIRAIKHRIEKQSEYLEEFQNIYGAIKEVRKDYAEHSHNNPVYSYLHGKLNTILDRIDASNIELISEWEEKLAGLHADYSIHLRHGEPVKQNNFLTSRCQLPIPCIATPSLSSWGDQLRFLHHENLPGEFPYTAGITSVRPDDVAPENLLVSYGYPETANHQLLGDMIQRQKTHACIWFDRPTQYARDPSRQLDVYEILGEEGVSVATLNDMKQLFAGIDLCGSQFSASLVANGAAPIILAFYLNTALDQQVELYLKQQGLWQSIVDKVALQARYKAGIDKPPSTTERPDDFGLGFLEIDPHQLVEQELIERISRDKLRHLKGKIYTDPFEADQVQNGCLYSLESSMKLMADIQHYAIHHQLDQFHTLTVSGFHMARAGTNPVTQLAFTLANGFTMLEYYLSQGLELDQVAPRFEFSFGTGLEAEYAVFGRVARRIWSRALRYVYGAQEESQKLRYQQLMEMQDSIHVQGLAGLKSTLSALYTIYDNSMLSQDRLQGVPGAMSVSISLKRIRALQQLIQKQMAPGLSLNSLQGSFLITELTDLVEDAVLREFDRLAERGGVPGAMDQHYQRDRIQEENYYALQKSMRKMTATSVTTTHNQKMANTDSVVSRPDIRNARLETLEAYVTRNRSLSPPALQQLQADLVSGNNSFEALLAASRVCTLEQLSDVISQAGGYYHRKP